MEDIKTFKSRLIYTIILLSRSSRRNGVIKLPLPWLWMHCVDSKSRNARKNGESQNHPERGKMDKIPKKLTEAEIDRLIAELDQKNESLRAKYNDRTEIIQRLEKL